MLNYKVYFCAIAFPLFMTLLPVSASQVMPVIDAFGYAQGSWGAVGFNSILPVPVYSDPDTLLPIEDHFNTGVSLIHVFREQQKSIQDHKIREAKYRQWLEWRRKLQTSKGVCEYSTAESADEDLICFYSFIEDDQESLCVQPVEKGKLEEAWNEYTETFKHSDQYSQILPTPNWDDSDESPSHPMLLCFVLALTQQAEHSNEMGGCIEGGLQCTNDLLMIAQTVIQNPNTVVEHHYHVDGPPPEDKWLWFIKLNECAKRLCIIDFGSKKNVATIKEKLAPVVMRANGKICFRYHSGGTENAPHLTIATAVDLQHILRWASCYVLDTTASKLIRYSLLSGEEDFQVDDELELNPLAPFLSGWTEASSSDSGSVSCFPDSFVMTEEEVRQKYKCADDADNEDTTASTINAGYEQQFLLDSRTTQNRKTIDAQNEAVSYIRKQMDKMRITCNRALFRGAHYYLLLQAGDIKPVRTHGCYIWEIDDFLAKREQSYEAVVKMKVDKIGFVSTPFYSEPRGYLMCMTLYPYGFDSAFDGVYISVFWHLLKGKYDGQLPRLLDKQIQICVVENEVDIRYSKDVSFPNGLPSRPPSLRNEGYGFLHYISMDSLSTISDCNHLKIMCLVTPHASRKK